jgi:hypothetical protein
VKYRLLLLSFFITARVCSQQNYWQQKVNFKMDVQLNDADHTLIGFAKIEYINHSPDTLQFIWFHLWPNAYRTDRTAFSDQLLENNRTDFYFSNKEDRGYINRLDFRVNNILAKTEDHPQHIDIIKLLLPQPLAPGASVNITTPFHVKLPKNFSRGGHIGQSYQITQWYPKPAVYDQKGWHPMPYLDQGEFYSEFGDYEVSITLPKDYVVLSSGALQSDEEKEWLKNRKSAPPVQKQTVVKYNAQKTKTAPPAPVQQETKTLTFLQSNIHDFAWFADKKYIVQYDTLQLPSGKIIDAYTAFYSNSQSWKKSLGFLKDAVLFRSKAIGEYPYNTVAAVEAVMGFEGGMEYPCITSISPTASEHDLEGVIEHEVGHNWFQGMLANNEQGYPWMDEGINSYYDNRFNNENSRFKTNKPAKKKIIELNYSDELMLYTLEQWKKDQLLNTPSDSLTETNYYLISYTKGAAFIQMLEKKLGREAFDKAMQQYFSTYKQKHVYPENLKVSLEQSTGTNLDSVFALLNKKGSFELQQKKKIRLAPFAGTQTEKSNTIIVSPVIGINLYDKLMVGGVITNYTLAPSRFQYLAAPVYSTGAKQMNGAARMSYTFFPNKIFQRVTLAFSGMKFNTGDFTDTAGKNYITGVRKLVPSVKLVLKETNPRSTRERFIQWKPFFFNEDDLKFRSDTFPNGNRFTEITKISAGRYLNQLKLVAQDTRALYPYRAELQAEQAKDFVRLAFTGNYYLNYNDHSGVDMRFFAGKFFYLGNKTFTKRFQNDPYYLNLTSPKGYEDYTYSNYFIGRTEFERFANQQIMMRDGGFKVRTDLLASKTGKTDNWLMAINFVSDIPDGFNILNVLPVKIPLKLYFDIGTYAEAWKQGSEESRFLFNGGLQLSLLKNTINIYCPLVYSRVYSDYFKSTIPEKRFLKNIAFSIDIQNISLKKIDRRLPF